MFTATGKKFAVYSLLTVSSSFWQYINYVKMETLNVPVIDVHMNNFKELWPSMLLAIKTSTFVAIDTELSGLGTRKELMAQCIEDRYKAICQAARTRSVLSLGIACFRQLPEKMANTYLSQVYNLTLLCMEEYIIEPQSVQFLVQHGFDFNKQYSVGIPYHKGNDKGNESQHQTVRTLFLEIIRAKKPLILHNGLIDVAFLYQCFYAHLPDRLTTFTTDLSEMFPSGLYDTKYAAEVEVRFIASYLEYAYKKCKRENYKLKETSAKHLTVEFCNYPASMSSFIDYRYCSVPDADGKVAKSENVPICEKFSAYGWCPDGLKCSMSHNIDLIIDEDERPTDDRKKRRRHKWKRKANKEQFSNDRTSCLVHSEEKDFMPPCKQPLIDQPCKEEMQTDKQEADEDIDSAHEENPDESLQVEGDPEQLSESLEHETQADDREQELHPVLQESVDISQPSGDAGIMEVDQGKQKAEEKKTMESRVRKSDGGGTHRAGFDAFMTGYILAYILMVKNQDNVELGTGLILPDCHNRLYLSGKSLPLKIVKSAFSKSSKAHSQKMVLAWGKN